MSRFIKCPGCSARVNTGFFGGGFFPIFECKKCHTRYCYLCPGSGEGKKCPSCGMREYVTAGECRPE